MLGVEFVEVALVFALVLGDAGVAGDGFGGVDVTDDGTRDTLAVWSLYRRRAD